VAIPLNEAVAGDVLSLDAIAPGGVVLLRAGSELTEQQLAQLADRGVKEVAVLREETGRPASVTGAGVEKAIAELDHMFSDVKGDPIMDSIYQVARTVLERVRQQS